MKKLFTFSVLVLLLFVFNDARAQKPAQSIYFELGGPGIASFNFDTRFTAKEGGIGGRIGIGGFSLGSTSLLAVPVGFNYLFGNDGRNYFELGGGATFVNFQNEYDDEGDSPLNNTFGHLVFGYRLQPKGGGFLFKAAMVPVFNKDGFLPYYAGIAFGYKFGVKTQ